MTASLPFALLPATVVATVSLTSTRPATSVEWCRYRFSSTKPPRPFAVNDLAHISLMPLLSHEECETIISAANDDERGWQHDVSDRYGTAAHRLPARLNIADVVSSKPLVSSRALFDLLSDLYLPRWERELASLFAETAGFPRALRLKFARIVKYEADLGQCELGLHQDGPLLTCNIALNSPLEYEGGGTILPLELEGANLDQEPPGGVLRPADTQVEGAGTAVVLPEGHALVHPGHVRHAGAPISSGARWLLGLFFDGAE